MKQILNLARPTTSANARTPATVAAKLQQGGARLVVDMPTTLHRKMKIHAIEQGKTIREYVLELLERDGLR